MLRMHGKTTHAPHELGMFGFIFFFATVRSTVATADLRSAVFTSVVYLLVCAHAEHEHKHDMRSMSCTLASSAGESKRTKNSLNSISKRSLLMHMYARSAYMFGKEYSVKSTNAAAYLITRIVTSGITPLCKEWC